MNGYSYDSKWKKLTSRLQNPQPGDCVATVANEVIVVMSDTQMIELTGSSDTTEPLPLGTGKYSIKERAKEAGFTVSNLDKTTAGLRIKVFRRGLKRQRQRRFSNDGNGDSANKV